VALRDPLKIEASQATVPRPGGVAVRELSHRWILSPHPQNHATRAVGRPRLNPGHHAPAGQRPTWPSTPHQRPSQRPSCEPNAPPAGRPAGDHKHEQARGQHLVGPGGCVGFATQVTRVMG
jgi:hypothetical protein